MCGIVGYCGKKVASEILLEGLRRLEYRGYDSAGICVSSGEELQLIKETGNISRLKERIPQGLQGSWGIGHTRWATHGEVNRANAHPHQDQEGNLALVHNGIIENAPILKAMLEKEGVTFKSQTDSEVLSHLVSRFYSKDLLEALSKALELIKGTYGVIVMDKRNPGVLAAARNGSPLVIGLGDEEMFLASDPSALAAYTRQVIFLEDGDMVQVTAGNFRRVNRQGQLKDSQIEELAWELEEMEKGRFSHFMIKEIHEQIQSIPRAFQGRVDWEQASSKLGGLNLTPREMLEIDRIILIAAGTSYYAAWTSAYFIESVTRIPCQVELASELRYRNPVVQPQSIYFAVSQSGETADTLGAMKEIQRKGGRVLGICNSVGSSIARESQGGIYIHSGPEVAVASTKAFTSQLTALYLFGLQLARMRDLPFSKGKAVLEELQGLPEKIRKILDNQDQISKLAKDFHQSRNFLYLGRGINYPVAMEGALKLKEISYIHAEGYSSAEIKHGPIALIQPETPSLFLVPQEGFREKVLSNMKEVKARKGPVIAIAQEGDRECKEIADRVLYVPTSSESFSPFLMVVPLQLFAYYCALELGRDVDRPRNLAKSVTVE